MSVAPYERIVELQAEVERYRSALLRIWALAPEDERTQIAREALMAAPEKESQA